MNQNNRVDSKLENNMSNSQNEKMNSKNHTQNKASNKNKQQASDGINLDYDYNTEYGDGDIPEIDK